MVMIPSRWEKQVWPKRRLPFDASGAMISGDTILSYEVKIFNGAGDDLSATMLAGSTNTDTIVYVWVQAGTSGTVYFLRIRIITTLGEQIEDDLAIMIREVHK
jgi:hypothetical protein